MGKLEVYCPACGTLFNSEEEMMEHYDKAHDSPGLEQELPTKEAPQLLVSDKMSDEEIKKRIVDDMINLSMHEAGTSWMRLGTLLSGNPSDQILGAGLKAIIDQNKIIIRQNELMIRALNRNKEKG